MAGVFGASGAATSIAHVSSIVSLMNCHAGGADFSLSESGAGPQVSAVTGQIRERTLSLSHSLSFDKAYLRVVAQHSRPGAPGSDKNPTANGYKLVPCSAGDDQGCFHWSISDLSLLLPEA
jgi:hypothetical protein